MVELQVALLRQLRHCFAGIIAIERAVGIAHRFANGQYIDLFAVDSMAAHGLEGEVVGLLAAMNLANSHLGEVEDIERWRREGVFEDGYFGVLDIVHLPYFLPGEYAQQGDANADGAR